MAKSFSNNDFLLPPQFLTDEDVLLETDFSESLFLNRFGSFSSSSPFDSTKMESDEEFFASLNLKMAGATIQDDWGKIDRVFGAENAKGLFLSDSPKSTLCTVGSGCGCQQWSSRSSPKCQSQLSSPPSSWDLLSAAAEVARLRAKEEAINREISLLAPPRKPSPNLDSGRFYSAHPLSHQKLKAAQFQPKQQQQMSVSPWAATKQELHVVQNRVKNNNSSDFIGIRAGPQGLSPTGPFLSQNGSGRRAVYLAKPAPPKRSSGTGVFLPRRIDSPSPAPPRKSKNPVPGCSTALLPARVVQALNLNLEEITPPPSNGRYIPDSFSGPRRGNGNGNPNPRRNFKARPGKKNDRDLRLPQDWSY